MIVPVQSKTVGFEQHAIMNIHRITLRKPLEWCGGQTADVYAIPTRIQPVCRDVLPLSIASLALHNARGATNVAPHVDFSLESQVELVSRLGSCAG